MKKIFFRDVSPYADPFSKETMIEMDYLQVTHDFGLSNDSEDGSIDVTSNKAMSFDEVTEVRWDQTLFNRVTQTKDDNAKLQGDIMDEL